eukprot:gene17938-15353_t
MGCGSSLSGTDENATKKTDGDEEGSICIKVSPPVPPPPVEGEEGAGKGTVQRLEERGA